MNIDETRTSQLGMPMGTASARLRKAVMLNLLQRLGEDKCYKCGEQIQTPEELSLEHKENWLHRDPALFWDLNNISFSHWRCNRPERHSGKGGKMYRKIGPVGTSWCSVHKRFLPVGQFQRNRSRWNGVHYTCRECTSEAKAKRRVCNVG